MKKIFLFILLYGAIFHVQTFAQNKSDSHIIGHVISEGQHLAFVNVSIKGSTLGTLTDETGHFRIMNVPVGTHRVVASMVGYVPQEIVVQSIANKTAEVNFEIEKDVLNISEVVVSSDRSAQKRTEAPVIVSTLPSKLFETTQSVTLGEGLIFTPGLRLENNCQNCGFTQVRMNGMEGPYSQILINSRPIFSGLAGVYGLEIIPANMIQRVEVVRGGGSALYGSNAIAGTINVILKDPIFNSFEIGTNYGLTGIGLNSARPATDYSVNFNTSLVSDDFKTGMSLYGFTRDRDMFDANGDGFSELAKLKNLTLGSRFFHSFGHRSKMSMDFFNIKEDREGGNKLDYPLHERDIAEAVNHDIKTLALNFERYFRDYDLLSVYVSGQFLIRESYYGANQTLNNYGRSVDKTFNIGAQYKAFFGHSTLITGLEHTGGYLKDEKLGYPDFENTVISGDSTFTIPHVGNTLVAHQRSLITGLFIQYELTWKDAKINIGGRLDQYEIKGMENDAESKSRIVLSPRLSLLYEITNYLQGRLSYSQGYRAPQIFDEDLHIETSGSRQVLHENDPDLIQENSHSVMASLDFNHKLGSVYTGFLIETFNTWLVNPFVNDIGSPDKNGIVIYTRMNADGGARVQGVNVEFKLQPPGRVSFNSGFTLQTSQYEKPQEFGETSFFRTPDHYGYLRLDYQLSTQTGVNISGSYTGPMLVPYFGPESQSPNGELHSSDFFFDLGIRAYHNQAMNGLNLQWFAGIKNVFNSYQDDFDIGINRDPAYMYGPNTPRMVYFGLKISSGRANDVISNMANEKGKGTSQIGQDTRKSQSRQRVRGRGK